MPVNDDIITYITLPTAICITIVKTRDFSEREKVCEHQNHDNAPYNNFITTTLNRAIKGSNSRGYIYL
jgi:hypothetical protein